MKAIVALVVGLAAGLAHAADLTDAEAARQAHELHKQTEAARATLNRLIKAGARDQYAEKFKRPLLAALRQWPEQSLNNRAIFPYWACKSAAANVLTYGEGWLRNDPSKIWRDHVVGNVRKDSQECEKSLRNPDMSLKNIR